MIQMHASPTARRVEQEAGSGARMIRDPCAVIQRERGAGCIRLRRVVGFPGHYDRKAPRRKQRSQPECERQRYIFFHR